MWSVYDCKVIKMWVVEIVVKWIKIVHFYFKKHDSLLFWKVWNFRVKAKR